MGGWGVVVVCAWSGWEVSMPAEQTQTSCLTARFFLSLCAAGFLCFCTYIHYCLNRQTRVQRSILYLSFYPAAVCCTSNLFIHFIILAHSLHHSHPQSSSSSSSYPS